MKKISDEVIVLEIGQTFDQFTEWSAGKIPQKYSATSWQESDGVWFTFIGFSTVAEKTGCLNLYQKLEVEFNAR